MINYPLKMIPVFKDYIWGGTKLKESYNKKSDMPVIAESWEVSTHPDGLSRIANGEFAGKTLKEVLGFDLPILIKFIDATDNLSLQVHPDDDYARAKEGDRGKNEMWYIAEAEPGAELILGFKEKLSEDELRELINSGNILSKVSHIPVKAGDCYCIPAGMIHAIGKGIVIVEVQQSSNVTYRVYDYDRRDDDGNPRQLHIDKAIDVLDTNLKAIKADSHILADWEYFHCELLTSQDGKTKQISTKIDSFECLTNLETGETSFFTI